MAKLDLVLFVQSCAIDRDTNSLSLFNLVEGLSVPSQIPDPPKDQFHTVGPPLSIVVVCRRSKPDVEESGTGRLRLFAPNRREAVGGEDFKIDLTGTTRGSRAVLRLPFLPYTGEGTYRVDVLVEVGSDKWKRIGSRELPVIKQA
jgi:hypothetical protein